MKVSLVRNDAPILQNVKFACDAPLSPRLEQWPMCRDHLNRFNTTLLCGRQGSGKTSLLVNLIKIVYRKVFHKIYVFMPATSRQSLKPNIFEQLPGEQLFEELNGDTIAYLYEELKENSEDGLKSLVIYDDVQKSLKDYETLKSLKNIIANQRHLNVTNLILVQNYFALDKSLRELINNLIFFKMDKSQTTKIFHDCIEMHKDMFDELRDFVFDKPYEWCFINMPSQRVYKKFDEVVFDDSELELPS